MIEEMDSVALSSEAMKKFKADKPIKTSLKRGEVNHIPSAIDLAGGPAAVRRLLGVSFTQIGNWKRAGSMATATTIFTFILSLASGIPMEKLVGRESMEALIGKELTAKYLRRNGGNGKRQGTEPGNT